MRGLGFGVGQEPLASLFASLGCTIVATDMAHDEAERAGWTVEDQFAGGLELLNKHGLCDEAVFRQRVSYRTVDMNADSRRPDWFRLHLVLVFVRTPRFDRPRPRLHQGADEVPAARGRRRAHHGIQRRVQPRDDRPRGDGPLQTEGLPEIGTVALLATAIGSVSTFGPGRCPTTTTSMPPLSARSTFAPRSSALRRPRSASSSGKVRSEPCQGPTPFGWCRRDAPRPTRR